MAGQRAQIPSQSAHMQEMRLGCGRWRAASGMLGDDVTVTEG